MNGREYYVHIFRYDKYEKNYIKRKYLKNFSINTVHKKKFNENKNKNMKIK